MKLQTKQPGPTPKQGAIILIFLFLIGVGVIYWIMNLDHQTTTIQQTTTQTATTQQSQASCLNTAYDQMDKKWKAADKDGDDKLTYSDGVTDINTAYYDESISCYRTYRTDDSDGYIADYQAKRQQETDKYTTWLEASKQPTYVPTYNNYRSSINCRSSSIGTSVYTTCD